MAPVPYFEEITVRGPFSFFLTLLLLLPFYNVILVVIACLACPSLIVAQPGGGDCFLFRPSRMPFLSVARLWSPFATASGSVALAGSHIFVNCLYYIWILCISGCSIHVSTKAT